MFLSNQTVTKRGAGLKIFIRLLKTIYTVYCNLLTCCKSRS